MSDPNYTCKVCHFDAHCLHDGEPMCYMCVSVVEKAKREQQKEQTVTLTVTLTDREANLVRSALALYASQGADGCTTECWSIRERIIEAQYAADVAYAENDGPLDDNEYNDDDGLTDAEADADTLASAGWGTDEDYGYYGGDE